MILYILVVVFVIIVVLPSIRHPRTKQRIEDDFLSMKRSAFGYTGDITSHVRGKSTNILAQEQLNCFSALFSTELSTNKNFLFSPNSRPSF